MAILMCAEWIARRLVDVVLNWTMGALLGFTVFIVGGVLFFLAVVVLGRLVRMLTAVLTPNTALTAKWLGYFYLAVQLVLLVQLFRAEGSMWPYIITKVEFTAVLVTMLLRAARDENAPGTD